uniref:Retrotransposon n=1 Tax=Oryza sativa subsp. japonica TaxID=39947 RepID=Q8S600_ORYSJ|nr:putative retrotransposon [Oryza sativa Japonica Group]
MTKQSSSKTEVEPTNVIPITLDDFEGEDCKSMKEYIKEITQEALMRACTRTRQGMIIKPGPRPKLTLDLVSNEEVTQSIQQQVASTIDSSMIIFKNKLDATIEGRFDEFLRTKFGPLMADFMLKDKASTSASQAPIDQTSRRTDGAAQTAGPTGPDGRSDRILPRRLDRDSGRSDRASGRRSDRALDRTFDSPVSTVATNSQVPPHVPNAYNDVARGYPPDTRQGQYNHITPQTQPIRPPNPPPNQHRPDNMEEIISGIIRDKFGIEARNRAKVYQKPYPDYYDNVPFPRGYRVPEFTKFSGEDSRTTWEHRFRDVRNRCYSLNITDRDLAGLTFNGLIAPLRERLDGQQFLDVSQLMQKALAQESRVKDNKKFVRPYEKKPNVNLIDYPEASDSEGEGDHDMYVAEWSWTNKNKPFVCSNLMPTPRKDWQSEVQSAIDEGRLKFTDSSKMKLDHDPFPVNTINFNDKKMLIRPEQAESTKGKGVVIGEPRPKMIVPKKPENRANEEKREGKRITVEARTSEVITIKVGSHDVPIPSGDEVGESSSNKPKAGTSSSQSAGLTRPSGRSDRSHTAGLTGPSGQSDRRPNDGPTDAPGRSDSRHHVGPTGAPGRSDRWSKSGLTGLQHRFDGRFTKGSAGTSSSSSRPNRGHYLPPGTEPKPRRFNELRPPPVWRRKSVEKEEPIVVEKKEKQSVDKDESSLKEDMDINMVCMLPMEFCAVDEAEVAQFSLGPKDAVFEKPDESNRHMKPLYLKGHIDGKPVSRMLVDGGAAVNLMLYSLFKKMGRGVDELKKTNMILNGFNDEPTEAKGIFSVELTVGNKTLPTAFFIVDVQDFDKVEKLGQGFTSADPLKEVDIGNGTKPRPTFVNKNMRADYKVKIIKLLKEYVDCFAWKYHEMPGLSRELVEHRLPIKPGFRPYKQPPRHFNPLLYDRVKEEIDRLLKAGFIRPCRYAEWVSSIVSVEKKGSGKIRVCIDFRDLNKATPKDEYPMPIADMMINDASGHKNAGATYQRAMNLIFHDLLGIILEIYIDDIVVKSDGMEGHIADLRLAFERMRQYGLKMNPLKCAFGVSAGRFLGFMVHERGVEIYPKKIEKIRDFKAPICKKEVQKLLGMVNYLRRFIFNLAGKIDAFVPILHLKKEADFTWGAKQQEAFEELKRYLSTPPVVRAPKAGKPIRLYIASEDKVIGAVLTQEEDGKVYIITYLSRHLLDAETRPILSGRIGKWAYALIKYDLAYEPLKSMRGQIACDFIVDHHVDIAYEEDVCLVEVIPWKIYFDGSSCKEGQGIGVVLFSPNGMCYEASVRLEYYCTNNQAEYNALLFDLQVMEMVGAKYVEAFGDSELVVQQVAEVYKCLDGSLNRYLDSCLDIIANFDNFAIRHIARHDNSRANDLAQQASGYDVKKGLFLLFEEPMLDFKFLCEIGEIGDQGRSDRRCAAGLTGDQVQSDRPHAADLTGDPGRSDRPCMAGLTGSGQGAGGHATINLEAKLIVNSDICAQETEEDWRIPLIRYLKDPTLKVDWKIRRQAFKYTLLDEDLYRQNIDDVLLKCLDEDQSKVAMGEGHRFVLVAMDYFTKWAEVVPLKNMTHTEIIDFILKHIIHRFGIPQTLTMDQAKSSNKTLLKLIKKKIEEHPKRWHEVLSEALWAHRISKHGATKVTPFELVYGQEAILPVEVNLGSLRYIKQDDLSGEDYKTLMGDNLDEVIDKRLKALEEIENEKKRVAKAYNKRVKVKLFQVGDLVWKTILSLGTRFREFDSRYSSKRQRGMCLHPNLASKVKIGKVAKIWKSTGFLRVGRSDRRVLGGQTAG